MSESSEIAGEIRRKAIELGFSACGFAPADSLNELEAGFREWLSAGKAGDMTYLTRNMDLRLDPRKLVEGAKTVISLAAPYYFPISPPVEGSPRISRYALGDDYHQVLKSRGKELLNWIRNQSGTAISRIFTDSAPVFEREWAKRAGIGWIGKNGCLIIPRSGSWFFLVEIITDLEIPSDASLVPDRCGNCTRCIDACPTQALRGDGSMDPRRCISYLTIEHRGAIPGEFRNKLGDWIFGCDICQDVCPWNRKPTESLIAELRPRENLIHTGGEFFRNLDAESFGQVFDGTPVERAGWKGIMRNFEFLESDGYQ